MDAGEEKKGKKRRLPGCLATVVVLGALLLGIILMVLRSQGGKDFVEDRLKKWLGHELTIRGVTLGFPLDLVVEELVSKDFDLPGEGGFKAEELRIGARGFNRLRIAVYKGRLNLVRREDGGWEPGFFSKLGDLPKRSISEISRLTSGFRNSVVFVINDGRISWLGPDGRLEAEAGGIVFRVTPVGVPGRQMFHYYLSVYTVVGPDGGRGHDIEREWLASDDHDYLELYRENRGLPATGQEFWEGRR